MKTNDLNFFGKQFQTDKYSEIHNYCEKYEKYLPFDRKEEIKILEIGIHQGASLRMWNSFFENSKVIGIDIEQNCKNQEDLDRNIFVEIGSQIDEQFLINVSNKYGPFDLIIDDGSHMQEHVIFSFEKLFNNLNKNGVYVIEDSRCSYWPYFKKDTIGSINYCKNLIDHVNFMGQTLHGSKPFHLSREDWHIEQLKQNNASGCRIDIESINFLNGIIIITKR